MRFADGGYHLEMKGISNLNITILLSLAGGYHLEMKGISNADAAFRSSSEVVIILK